MIGAGHAGQGKHQWNVSKAGVQRVAYVSQSLLELPWDISIVELICKL